MTVAAPRPATPAAGVAPEVRLAVRGLGKRWPSGTQALADVDLDVRAGELVVVLGANGSGKSTLLRCLVRLADPSAGSVHVDGEDLATLSGPALRSARRTMGFVFQKPSLVGRRTALANVASGALGRLRGPASRLGRFPRAEWEPALAGLRRVGVADVAFQRADTLSGGQAQRVAIARALRQAPRVLLADEPVASLDPEAARGVMELLRDLAANDGLAVLCVLHQPELALRYADRIVGLRAGRVRFDRAAGDVVRTECDGLYRTASPGHAEATAPDPVRAAEATTAGATVPDPLRSEPAAAGRALRAEAADV